MWRTWGGNMGLAIVAPAGACVRTRRLTLVAATLWACSCSTPLFAQGVGQGAPANPADEANCGRLEGYRIASSAIGLPTSGGAVTSAVVVKAAPQSVRPPNTGPNNRR